MKIPTFFRFLNKKIEKYDRLATNPFTTPQSIVLIWVEDSKTSNPTNVNPPVTESAEADLE